MDPTQKDQMIGEPGEELAGQNGDERTDQRANPSGERWMRRVPVFPGIELIYHNMQATHCTNDTARSMPHIIEIEHCREGRVEYQHGNQYVFLSPGEFFIARRAEDGQEAIFPSGHYSGVTIALDVNRTPDTLSPFLPDWGRCPTALVEKLCPGSALFLCRNMPALDHAFSELYAVPEQVQTGFVREKLLEILRLLGQLSPKDGADVPGCSVKQIKLTKEASLFLAEHKDRSVTIAQLARQFEISDTYLKNCFRAVYGMSVYTYVRAQKMQSAAWMLRTTDQTVLEISGAHGYDNGSKFAQAFCKVVGSTPNHYRKTHRSSNQV